MAQTILVRDETTSGVVHHEFTMDVLTERVTVRELIRSRVYQEVQDYNVKMDGTFMGMVQPTDAEVLVNAYKLKRGKCLDWEQQFEKALQAFRGNGILILVDERQYTELDEDVIIQQDSVVSFLKLVPLVGG